MTSTDAQSLSRRKIAVFLLVTAVLTTPIYLRAIPTHTLDVLTALMLMWAPGVSALLTQLIFQRNVRGLGWGWGKTRYQLGSFGLPILLGLVVYGIVWLVGAGGFYDQTFIAEQMDYLGKTFGLSTESPFVIILAVVAMDLVLGIISAFLFELGEEIGWRGLLVPELAKLTTFSKTAFISGAIWAVWHFPAFLFLDYHSNAPLWYAVLWGSAGIMAASFAMTWFRLKSGSLWTAVLFHGMHNMFIQEFFDPITADTGMTEYVIGEFGFAVPLAYAIVGYLFWRKRRELPER